MVLENANVLTVNRGLDLTSVELGPQRSAPIYDLFAVSVCSCPARKVAIFSLLTLLETSGRADLPQIRTTLAAWAAATVRLSVPSCRWWSRMSAANQWTSAIARPGCSM